MESLRERFTQMQNRMIAAMNQLDNEDLNWRPGKESNSIANLVIHISGNVHQRIESGIEGKIDTRDREAEFDQDVYYEKEELIDIISKSFSKIIKVISNLSTEDLLKMQTIRSQKVTNFEVLMRCATHFSEHLGQILYIAKMRTKDTYVSTSIPRKND